MKNYVIQSKIDMLELYSTKQLEELTGFTQRYFQRAIQLGKLKVTRLDKRREGGNKILGKDFLDFYFEEVCNSLFKRIGE